MWSRGIGVWHCGIGGACGGAWAAVGGDEGVEQRVHLGSTMSLADLAFDCVVVAGILCWSVVTYLGIVRYF